MMDDEFIDTERVSEIVDKLEIKVENIYHLLLSNGMELVAEIFPPEDQTTSLEELLQDSNGETYETSSEDSDEYFTIEMDDEFNDILFLNPIKVYRDVGFTEDGNYYSASYFTEWNPHTEGPYTHISKNNIVSMNSPNEETLNRYIVSVYQEYYPMIDSLLTGDIDFPTDVKLQSPKSIGEINHLNIIDFESYYLKRKLGNF